MHSKTNNQDKIILLDSDVIIHFSIGDSLLSLMDIFPHYHKCVLDIVYGEINRRISSAQSQLDLMINMGVLTKINFPPISSPVYQEYIKMRKENPRIDSGEAACMAYLRFNKHVLASSNFKDIVAYCEQHDIYYISTMDFLKEAMAKNIFTEEQCDKFIEKVKKAGSKLPCNYMFEYKSDRFLES
jgi:hypothetical protein